MKRIIFIICFLASIISFCVPCNANEINIQQLQRSKLTESTENSKELIYRDVVLSLLVPYMQKEVNNYYKDYLTESPTVAPYMVDLINSTREGSGYLIQLEVIVHPYVGPHNPVGDDRMIIETGAWGSVEIKEFEHLKSYPLPFNWQHIIKKRF